jgi:hypothetical protein
MDLRDIRYESETGPVYFRTESKFVCMGFIQLPDLLNKNQLLILLLYNRIV